MKIHIELFTLGLSLRSRLVDLRQESVNLWGKVLLVHHVEADNHVCVLSSLENGVNLRLDVVFANDLQSTHYDLHLEQWEAILNLLLHPFKDLHFLNSSNRSILIEDHSKDVLPLNYSDALLDQVFAHSV